MVEVCTGTMAPWYPVALKKKKKYTTLIFKMVSYEAGATRNAPEEQ
jgi:hypothetical protein